jgi:hypothetical protein
MAKEKKIVKVKQTESLKRIPVGVQIISVLSYISAVIFALLGLLFIIFSNYISTGLAQLNLTVSPIAFVFGGIAAIGFGVLGFFIGRDLWKLKQWARYATIIFAALGVIYEIYSIISGYSLIKEIIYLVFYGFIGAYLLFNKEVKGAFK